MLSVELLVLALLWLGILFLNTDEEQVAAWPQLFFWSTAFSLGTACMVIVATLGSASRALISGSLGALQSAFFYMLSGTVAFFVLSVATFLLRAEQQNWLHGVLYEPSYAYLENVWVTQLKFVGFTVTGFFGVLGALLVLLLARGAAQGSGQKNTDDTVNLQEILISPVDIVTQSVAWGQLFRVHLIHTALLVDCLSRYLTRVCNDAGQQGQVCPFTPLDIPPRQNDSATTTQCMEYGAFILVDLVCDVLVSRQHISATRNTQPTQQIPQQSTRRVQYTIIATRAVQLTVEMVLLVAYIEQRFEVLSEYLAVVFVLVFLATVYSDVRDLSVLQMLQRGPPQKQARQSRRLKTIDSELRASNPLDFRDELFAGVHAPPGTPVRHRFGVKNE